MRSDYSYLCLHNYKCYHYCSTDRALFYKHKGRLYVHLPSHQKGWFKRKRERGQGRRKEKGGRWAQRGAGLLNEPFRKYYVIDFVCVCILNMLLPKLGIEKCSMGIMSEIQ